METVIQRAFAAVEAVNLRIADLQKTGGMKELKRRIQSGKEGREGRSLSRFSARQENDDVRGDRTTALTPPARRRRYARWQTEFSSATRVRTA
jgi:hypothetical protein